MIITTIAVTAATIIVPACFAWMWSVEKRLNAQEAIIGKLDELITILLENRLGHP